MQYPISPAFASFSFQLLLPLSGKPPLILRANDHYYPSLIPSEVKDPINLWIVIEQHHQKRHGVQAGISEKAVEEAILQPGSEGIKLKGRRRGQ